MFDRRKFLKRLASVTAGLSVSGSHLRGMALQASDNLGKLLPRRKLGKTNEAVTILGLGGWHLGRMNERDAQQTVEASLAGGIRFFDSAESYQDGGSEEYLGRFLTPKYRDSIFLMTKTTANDAKTARSHLEGSLSRMKTDYLDLWQIHAVGSPEDVDNRLAQGVLEVVLQARDEGKVRHIGFTGHHDPSAHRRMLERTDVLQTCQMPINAADPSYQSFILGVLPTVVERNMGAIAMKTLANGGFFGGSEHGQHGDNPKLVPGRISVSEALSFAWSLPISVLITGPDNIEHLNQKIRLAKSFNRLSQDDRQRLIDRVADLAGKRVEFYKV